MGQKIHPHGYRVGVIKDWDARWYANKKDFANNILEDDKIRKYLKKKLYIAGISKIEIERAASRITINLYVGKPGIIIGKGGAGIEIIKKDILKLIGKEANINIIEVKNQNMNAQLVAENIASSLEKRISFRRAMKKAISGTMQAGAKGVKTTVGGRLGGADIARSESYHEGSIPLQTLRANIDYGFAEAKTTYGILGVKVWIYKDEVLGKGFVKDEDPAPRRNQRRDREGGRKHVNA